MTRTVTYEVPVQSPVRLHQLRLRILDDRAFVDVQEYVCDWCKRKFIPERKTARHCSDKCRQLNHRKGVQ